ncbi:MAG: hypothetical protein ACOY33_04905 [Pseudomonadota bacterium]
MKYGVKFGWLLLAALALPGCDVAGKANIGNPINTDPNLDPEDDGNIVAFFYTDRPVSGLVYVCSKSGARVIVSKTDENGSFVCPRDRRVTFYVGEPAQLKLGYVDLEIFGRRAPVSDDPDVEGEADARERVTITPSTLYGTTADSSNQIVANIFQLLYLLDTSSGSEPQDRIVLSEALHEAFSPLANQVRLDLTPGVFVASYETAIASLNGHVLSTTGCSGCPPAEVVDLRSNGVALDTPELYALVDRALLAVRAGVYRYVPFVFDISGAFTFQGTLGMMVGRNGQITGMGSYWESDFSVPGSPLFDFEVMTLDPGAVIYANGLLGADPASGILFHSTQGDPFAVTGRLVNDRLSAAASELDHNRTYKIPDTYDFSSLDIGEFTAGTADKFQETLTVYRQLESQPDVDHDLLGGAYLPREFGVLYRDYPDGIAVDDTDRLDPGYVASRPEKQLRFRILANGDIVSDVDADCTDVADDNGTYKDADGTVESVIGQSGTIFESGSKTYMTISLAVFDQAHEAFGFQLGLSALDGVNLDQVVIDVATGDLLNKRCDPEVGDCDRPIEWFNTDVFYRDVYKVLVESTGSTPDHSPETALMKPDYYGRVTGFAELCP